jgi:hypothetical protein
MQVMGDCFSENIAVIARRWPDIYQQLNAVDPVDFQPEIKEGLASTLVINGIQLTSRHDRIHEAKVQTDSLPQAAILHLYGVGLGDIPRILLERKSLHCLHVYILNEALFLLVNHLLDHSDWLSDQRVVLHFACDFKDINLPFFVSPSERQLSSQ